MSDEFDTEPSDEPVASAEDIISWKRKLEELSSFMRTSAYRHGYLPTYRQDILDIELNILNTIPADQVTLSHVLMLHGQRTELQRALNFFESSQAALKDKIAAAEDAQTEEPDNKESKNE